MVSCWDNPAPAKKPSGPPPKKKVEEQWAPELSHNDFWGADETEYWAQKDAEDKAIAKAEQATAAKVRKHVDELVPEILKWDQPSIGQGSLMDEVAKAREQPLPLTYTAISKSTDTTKPENQRRLFKNLHRQLEQEFERAKQSGSWVDIPGSEWEQIERLVIETAEHWDDPYVKVFEPKVRELVKLLIATRRRPPAKLI